MRLLLCAFILWVIAPTEAPAQAGSLTGTVLDSVTGKPVPGVDVALRCNDKLCGHVSTDDTGAYAFPELAAGIYSVAFVNVVYDKRTAYISVESGMPYRLNVRLYDLTEGKETSWAKPFQLWDWQSFEPGKTVISRDPHSAIRIR